MKRNILKKESSLSSQLCWTMKWYCHDPVAHQIFDLRDTSCHGDNWSTIGCCYAGDNGAGCNHDQVVADAR